MSFFKLPAASYTSQCNMKDQNQSMKQWTLHKEYSRISKNIWEYPGISTKVQEYPRIPRNIQEYHRISMNIGEYWGISEYISKNTQEYPKISKNIQEYPRISKVIQGYLRISTKSFGNLQLFHLGYKKFNTLSMFESCNKKASNMLFCLKEPVTNYPFP